MKWVALLVAFLFVASIVPGCLEVETKFSVGGGDEQWWVNYKDAREEHAGGTVIHPQWVLDALQSKPVVFVIHKNSCYTCKPQADRMNEIAEDINKYTEKIAFFDLVLDGDSAEYNQAQSAFIYDPNGGDSYIALTGIITKVKDASGNVAIGWHAWEGNTGEEEMIDWVEDAIAHYSDNG